MSFKKSRARVRIEQDSIYNCIRVFPASLNSFYDVRADKANAVLHGNVFETQVDWTVQIWGIPGVNSSILYSRQNKKEALKLAVWLVRSKRHAKRWDEIPEVVR